MSKVKTRGEKMLLFTVAQEIFAIPLLQVQEVLGVVPHRPLPGSPPHIIGLINRRRRVILIVELGMLLGMEPASVERPVMIICRHGKTLIALKVNSVDRVDTFLPTEIRPAPQLAVTSINPDLVSGIVEKDKKTIITLNLTPCFESVLREIKVNAA